MTFDTNSILVTPLGKFGNTTVWGSPRGGHRRPALLCYLRSHTPVFSVTKGSRLFAPTMFTTKCVDCDRVRTRTI